MFFKVNENIQTFDRYLMKNEFKLNNYLQIQLIYEIMSKQLLPEQSRKGPVKWITSN